MVVQPALLIGAAGLAVALFSASGNAMIQPEIGVMSCELFLNDIDASPANYDLYRAFAQGYLAANAANHAGDDAVMASLIVYCQAHASQHITAAIGAVLKK